MKTYLDCIPCFLRQGLDGARIASEDTRLHEQTMRDLLCLTAELDLNRSPPEVGQAIHRRLRELTKTEDPYQAAKDRFNQLVMDLLPELTALIKQSTEPLVTAAKLAIVANVIDMGITSTITAQQIRSALKDANRATFSGDWQEFGLKAAEATDILYLADNAGEIAVDRLLVEELGSERVTMAVRGKPVINDATLADARQVRMHELVEVIDNGSDAPGTILDDCSAAFQKRFHKADLIIAKGQGNFETLSEVDANLFFLFKVKCPVVADHVALPLGTHALLYARRKRRANPKVKTADAQT